MAKWIRCYACSSFFDTKLDACPYCDTEKRPLNVALVNQRWASNLNKQADHAARYG